MPKTLSHLLFTLSSWKKPAKSSDLSKSNCMAFVSFIETTIGVNWELMLQCAIKTAPASFSSTLVFIHNIVYRLEVRDQLLKLLIEKWVHQSPEWDTLNECRALVDCHQAYVQVYVQVIIFHSSIIK